VIALVLGLWIGSRRQQRALAVHVGMLTRAAAPAEPQQAWRIRVMMWNRLRYTLWAPAYDALVSAAGFEAARRLSIDRLKLAPSARVLIVGAGTGLDLDFLPSNVHVTAIDVTPAMLKQLERRAARAGRSVTARVMDARQLEFPDSSFDAVVMHLIVAVMPQPERGVREALRVLKRGGRIAIFDKFLRDEERPSLKRRLLNALAKPLFSDLNRRLGPLIEGTPLVIEHDDPIAFGGTYRVVTLLNADHGSRAATETMPV
jgi:phosphatidylethanolamine/phosphatidyl-N-methylethanolamine N-methyltransferase